MARTLGIDIGSNSIGWAEVENGKLVHGGSRIYQARPATKPHRHILPKLSAEQTARHALLAIAVGAAALAAFFAPQFWGTVAFSALITWLSFFRR